MDESNIYPMVYETYKIITRKRENDGTIICIALDKDGLSWKLIMSETSNDVFATMLESNNRKFKYLFRDN